MASGAVSYNNSLIDRQVEISEWTYNDKLETLFVMQIIFISLLLVSLFLMLWKSGAIGATFSLYSIVIIVLLMTVVIANRASYTKNYRDRRHWNRQRFADDGKLPSPLGRGDASYQQYIDDVRAEYGASGPACPASCRR
jgi:hypothetical protein